LLEQTEEVHFEQHSAARANAAGREEALGFWKALRLPGVIMVGIFYVEISSIIKTHLIVRNNAVVFCFFICLREIIGLCNLTLTQYKDNFFI